MEIFHSSSPDKSEVIGTFCHAFDEKAIQYYNYDRKQDNQTDQIALPPAEHTSCLIFKEKISRRLHESCFFNNSYISESYMLRGPPLLSVL
jgi:hypothetical protein